MTGFPFLLGCLFGCLLAVTLSATSLLTVVSYKLQARANLSFSAQPRTWSAYLFFPTL
jgi:hypothetical protein